MIELSKVMAHGAADQHLVWCPGCDCLHGFHVNSASEHNGSQWGWNGSVDKPTFTPSLLVNKDNPQLRCHSFLTDGVWSFLGDCFHKLANQKIPMVDLPEWLVEGCYAVLLSHHGTTEAPD